MKILANILLLNLAFRILRVVKWSNNFCSQRFQQVANHRYVTFTLIACTSITNVNLERADFARFFQMT
jgi:hypothetical protein